MKDGKEGTRANGQVGDAPTPRGERPRVPQARLAGSERSIQREIDNMCRPIRRSLFGGLPGRQACAAGWAASRPLEASAARSAAPRHGTKGPQAHQTT